MTNKVILSGRLGDKPQLRTTTSGKSIASFSMATSKSYRDGSGERVEQTEWHRVTAFGATARYAADKLEKGQLVMVEGALHYSKWTDRENVVRYSTEIQAEQVNGLTMPKNSAPGEPKESAPAEAGDRDFDGDMDDNVPF